MKRNLKVPSSIAGCNAFVNEDRVENNVGGYIPTTGELFERNDAI
jgi:hypothetical protein